MAKMSISSVQVVALTFLVVFVVILLTTSTLARAEPGSSSRKSSSRSSSSSSGSNGSKMNCTTALGKCTRRMPCGMALHDYRISCKQELYGHSKNCSELCQLAIISLASTPEGHDYLNCDCTKNDYCKLIRNRTQSCNPKRVSKEGDHETCRGAELFCKADTVCNASFDYYRRSCSDLIKGKTKECPRRCNNTVILLWRQKAGMSLKNCSCDKGSYKCRKERESIMRTCLGLSDYRAGYTSSAPRSPRITVSASVLTNPLLSLLALFAGVWTLRGPKPQRIMSKGMTGAAVARSRSWWTSEPGVRT